jgi:AcrR family transcriptional regulator
VVEPSVSRLSGLRERKKERTRRTLINAAVDLCVRQGYESTTVEQISQAADVSRRTFSRYFATKDAVFIAVVDDLTDEIGAELTAQPSALGPMEALRAAFVAVLTRVAERPLVGLTTDRIVLILRVVYSSPALRQAAIDYRSRPTMVALARHMGVPPDDPNLDLAVALFNTTVVSACSDLVAGEADVPLGPEGVMARLEETLRQVAALAAELRLP